MATTRTRWLIPLPSSPSGGPYRFKWMVLPVLLLAAVAPTASRAATIRVPNDYPTIQAAIGAAQAGDTVLVASGTYSFRDPISFMGKNITVRSERGPFETTLRLFNPKDPARASVVIFDSGENRNAVLEGFTITGGLGTEGGVRPKLGGGILCYRSGPTIRYNVMRGNKMSEDGHGGGIAIVGWAYPKVVHNLICYNTTPRGGGGVFFGQAGGTLMENTITGNISGDDGGGICSEFSNPLIQGNTIVGNVARTFGGGISNIEHPRPVIINNTITGNVAGDFGGGLTVTEPPLTVRNCIIRGNLQLQGLEIAQMEPEAMPEIFYCCLTSGPACLKNGNHCADPLFLDPGGWEPCELNPDAPCVDLGWDIGVGATFASWRTGNYELPPESPCIDAGDLQDPPDPDGSRADIGAIDFDIERAFLRGDLDADRVLRIADVLTILRGIFADASEIGCQDAADVDDDGRVGLADAILLLLHIFSVPPPEIPPPRTYPGPDPTRDRLRCGSWAGLVEPA